MAPNRVFAFTNERRWSPCFSMSAARNSLKAELQRIRGPNQKTLDDEIRLLTSAATILNSP
jgi:hypothetical protein